MKEQDLWDEYAHYFFAAFQSLWQPRPGMIPWIIEDWAFVIQEQQLLRNEFVKDWQVKDGDCFCLKRLWASGIRHKLFRWENAQVGAKIQPFVSTERQEKLLLQEEAVPIYELVQSYLSRFM